MYEQRYHTLVFDAPHSNWHHGQFQWLRVSQTHSGRVSAAARRMAASIAVMVTVLFAVLSGPSALQSSTTLQQVRGGTYSSLQQAATNGGIAFTRAYTGTNGGPGVP